AVRDQLLEFPYTETDWVVVGSTPKDMLDAGFKQVGKDFPVFLHPDSNEEYALARTERKSGHGYHGFEIDAHPDVTLEQDLERRDLTINAMAMLDDGQLIDPYGGKADLDARVLRHVSFAFAEDPLRVLRVARFAARYHHLGFSIAEETQALMQQLSNSGELQELARERIWQELAKGLNEISPQILLQVLQNCGALSELAPTWAKSLDEEVYAVLHRAASLGLNTEQRFAISCMKLTDTQLTALCEAISTPKAHKLLASLHIKLRPLPEAAPSAQQIFQVLEQSDFLRRPERLEQVIGIEQVRTGAKYAVYRDAANAIRTLSSEDLQAQGVTGKALGQALREQRLERIQRLLQKREP
ncbi:MAG: tRNA nucleotidyltransferase (CCA-adding enzyme), partial [Bermanella sp.]